MSALRIGQEVKVDGLDPKRGPWSVWSQSDECPGAYSAIPSSGGGYAVIRATSVKGAAKPRLDVLRVERR